MTNPADRGILDKSTEWEPARRGDSNGRREAVEGNGDDLSVSWKPPPPIPRSSLRSDQQRQGKSSRMTPSWRALPISLTGDGARLSSGRVFGPAAARQSLAVVRQRACPLR